MRLSEQPHWVKVKVYETFLACSLAAGEAKPILIHLCE